MNKEEYQEKWNSFQTKALLRGTLHYRSESILSFLTDAKLLNIYEESFYNKRFPMTVLRYSYHGRNYEFHFIDDYEVDLFVQDSIHLSLIDTDELFTDASSKEIKSLLKLLQSFVDKETSL